MIAARRTLPPPNEAGSNPASTSRVAIDSLLLATVLACFAMLSGCEEPKIAFREVVRIEERLNPTEVEKLHEIAALMPNGRLPAMSPHFLPPPSWDTERPATVATLAGEEVSRLREVTSLESLASSLAKNNRLRYALKRVSLTRDQYVGLVLSVGLATQRHLTDPSRDLETYRTAGRDRVRKLRTEHFSFAALPKEQQIDRIEQGTWITRLDRVERLLKIPEENVTFAESEYVRLDKILPKQFLNDPLLGLNDPLIDFGVPFRERAKTGFDTEIAWDAQSPDAVVNGRRRSPINEFAAKAKDEQAER